MAGIVVPTAELTAAGWEALRTAAWETARRRFDEALERAESAEALEGLGWAHYFLDDDAATISVREQAYHAYRREGEEASAARVASWLAADHLEFHGATAVANGWLQRARRLLEDVPAGPDHGWLAIHTASMCLLDDPAHAKELGRQAADLGRRFDVPELEMVGLATEGQAGVLLGDLEAGMERLDEATTLALSGEAQLLACVAWACCYLISACELVRDYERAGQWSHHVTVYCERHGIGVLLGQCRAKYAGVLIWQGRWDEAEAQLDRAERELATARPALVGEALVRLADLRREQGRDREAAELYARCDGQLHGLIGQAWLALPHRPEQALALADRYLRRLPPDDPERSGGLEVRLHACLELEDIEGAVEVLHRIEALAEQVRTPALAAMASRGAGHLARASGRLDEALLAFEDAIDLLASAGAPVEVARTRGDLADVLERLGRHDAACEELEVAIGDLRTFPVDAELARLHHRRVTLADRGQLTSDPVPAPSTGTIGAPDETRLALLTPREREVLTLVATGRTNGQIAQALVLSEHTVHRHVANILRKLDAPSRTAAASLAVAHGLFPGR